MEPTRAAGALAEASAALVAAHDIPGFLVDLLRSCQEVLDVDAGGVLLQSDGHLELLAASNHEAAHLELYQADHREGPCFDAHRTAVAIGAAGDELASRWPDFGTTLLDTGFHAVQASPLRWRGSAIGALGLFRHSATPFSPDEAAVAQGFADISTLLITQAEGASVEEHIARALSSRVVIEQAKGVLSENDGLDMGMAYQQMVQQAAHERVSLTEIANRLIAQAQRS
jgi:hypothetical protein